MKPKERDPTGQGDMFRARLDQILDMGHEKVVLAGKMIGAFWPIGAVRPTSTSPVTRPCRRG